MSAIDARLRKLEEAAGRANTSEAFTAEALKALTDDELDRLEAIAQRWDDEMGNIPMPLPVGLSLSEILALEAGNPAGFFRAAQEAVSHGL